jgi:hypothetical protein
MPPPYDDVTALAYARQVGPAFGLGDAQLPTAILAAVLNGMAECKAVLDAIPQATSPAPITQLVPDWLP